MGSMAGSGPGSVQSQRRTSSYYLDRHGDPALPLPHTPWWRLRQLRGRETAGFRFA